jgi:hypothetical protein
MIAMSDEELRGLLQEFQRQNLEAHADTYRRFGDVDRFALSCAAGAA